MTLPPSSPDTWSPAFAMRAVEGQRIAFACDCDEPRELRERAGTFVCGACGAPARPVPEGARGPQ